MKSYDEIKEILLRDYPKYFDILDLDMQIRQLIGVDPGRYKEILDKNLENSMDVEKTWADNKALRDHNWLERNYNRHLNTYNDIKNKGGNNMYESIRTNLKESSLMDPAYTVCYNRLDVFPTRKSAMDFFRDCMRNSEGAERERYANVLLDLMDGASTAYDDPDDGSVNELSWVNEDGKSVEVQKLDGWQDANIIVKKINGGKIFPPKGFLDVFSSLHKEDLEESQKLNEREEERSWSDDGKSLNIREMVARALEDNIHDKEFTDEEIDEIFGEVVDNDQYMEEIYMEIVNQTLEAAKKFRGE